VLRRKAETFHLSPGTLGDGCRDKGFCLTSFDIPLSEHDPRHPRQSPTRRNILVAATGAAGVSVSQCEETGVFEQ